MPRLQAGAPRVAATIKRRMFALLTFWDNLQQFNYKRFADSPHQIPYRPARRARRLQGTWLGGALGAGGTQAGGCAWPL